MSYSFSIKVKDGKLEVPEEVSYVPDGEFAIGGHVDDGGTNESIWIQRKDASNTLVASTQSYHK